MTARSSKKSDGPTIVKKYANRRLYDTGRSSYVTLDDLYEMVKEGHDFVVCDAKSGEDLTRSVLTQIIVDKESKGENMLPIGFLKQLIGFYGDSVQSLVPNYLEHSLDSFAKRQEDFQSYVNKSLEGMFAIDTFEEMSKRNIEMFEKTMSIFSPFSTTKNASSIDKETRKKEIQETINKLQEELNKL